MEAPGDRIEAPGDRIEAPDDCKEAFHSARVRIVAIW